jgi:transposase
MPIVQEFYRWVDDIRPQAVPGTPICEAIKYATNQRTYFERCFEDGRFEIDNGAREHATGTGGQS